MRICVDIRQLYQKLTGVGCYTKNLVEALSEIDGNNTYLLLAGHFWHDFRAKLGSYACPGRANFGVYARKLPSSIFTFDGVVPLEFYTGGSNVFHATNYLLPSVKNAKKVVTIHDLSFEIEPAWYPPGMKGFRRRARESAAQADRIIAVSESTKNDIVRIYGINPGKIDLVYYGSPGIPEKNFSAPEMESARKKYSLPEKYFLSIGTLEPRKNIKGMLEAYVIARKSGLKHKLVMIGNRGWKTDEILKSAGISGFERDVLFSGYVENERLPAIYSMAEALVFPSLYEGFGLPVVEAMAYSLPVITSNISSLPEVAGDAALYADPRDPGRIAEAMLSMAGNPELRRTLIKKGLDRVKLFSWQKTAKQTLDTYYKAMQ